MPEPILAFTRVSKRFADGTVALAGVDLRVAPGEFVSVVGPSGCGKSTLLRIASGLSEASEGTVTVRTDKPGYVFQDPTLLPWRTVQANVELFAELRGLPKEERRRRAEEAIELVGLSDFARHRPRALFGALDEITRERLNDELLQLFLARRFAALFVTHSVTEAVYMSTRVVVMSGRPGQVLGDFAVPFDYPRSSQLRFDEPFAHLAGQVSARLRGTSRTTGGGSGGLKSEATAQVAGGHAEPSGSPPVNQGSGGLKSEAGTQAAGGHATPSGSPPVDKAVHR